MEIRLAQEGDLESLMEMFAYSRKLMRENGNTVQWVHGYPQQELILESIRKGEQYVLLENGEPVGTFCFILGEDPNYLLIERGNWLNRRPYGVIHRIASNGKAKGIAACCFTWCFERFPNIRVDTHETNRAMRHVLQKTGYVECGVIYVPDGTPRLAFQKTE